MNIGDWPNDLVPYRWQFYLQPNTRAFVSPVTRTRQVLAGQGPRYVATGSWRFSTLRAVGRKRAQRFEALLDKLKGQVGTVNMFDFVSCGMPLGTNRDLSSIGDSFFTDGTSFTDDESPETLTTFGPGDAGVTVYGNWPRASTSVRVTGFPQSTTQLLAGDSVQLGSFLYRLTEDAESDGFNRAYLYLNRPLIEDITHLDAVVRTRPRTPMQLLDDDQSQRTADISGIREYTVSFLEAFF